MNNSTQLMSASLQSTGGDTFPMTPVGLAVMFLAGVLSGAFITTVFFVVYIKWMKAQSSKQENTYVDLDLDVDNEEKPPEYTQRGSVAFVREIASVYYSQVGNDGNESPQERPSSSIRSSLFSWSSSKSRKSASERKSGLNRIPPHNKSAVKQMFTYEQPVVEEGNDYVDLDSPTTPTKPFDYENEKTENKNRSNPNCITNPVNASENQTDKPLNDKDVLENKTDEPVHCNTSKNEIHNQNDKPVYSEHAGNDQDGSSTMA